LMLILFIYILTYKKINYNNWSFKKPKPLKQNSKIFV
jgi:hypothetical protein